MKEDIFQLGIKALIRNSDGKILLLKVNPRSLVGPAGSEYKKTYWDIPGGRIERGSTIEETLRREVEEETGITEILSYEKVDMVLSNIRIPLKTGSDTGLVLGVYSCDVTKVDIKISDEHTEAEWFSPLEAAKLLAVKYPSEFTDKIAAL